MAGFNGLGLFPVEIDVYKKHKVSTINAHEDDVNGRGLLVTLLKDGVPFNTTGIDLKLAFRNAIGEERLFAFSVVDLVTGKYSVTYPREMLEGNGGRVVRVEIKAYDTATQAMISYSPLNVYVSEAVVTEGQLVTNSQGSEFVQLLERVETVETGLGDLDPVHIANVVTLSENAVLAEAGRVSAESGRVSAETARATAESSRQTAEGARQTAESNRASAESTRVSSETSRGLAETARATAEDLRASAEVSRATAETSRKNAESARVTTESNRATAESLRVTAESSRVNAESARNSNESQRLLAEDERVDNEGSRISAESARVIAEQTRASFYDGFNAQLNDIVQVPMSKLSRSVVGNVSSLKGWNKDFTGRLHIAVLGDSISEGAWADADRSKWNIFSWVAKLRQALSEVYGYAGEGFISLGTSRFVRTGTWTLNADFAPHGYCYYSTGESNYITLSGIYGDTLDIFYVNNAAIAFKVSVDGGADQLISSFGPYRNQSVVATIPLGSVGNHTVVIKAPATGTLFLQGAAIYIGNTGVVIHNIALSGATVYSGATYKMTTRLTPLNVISPKLSIFNFLANDYNYQSTTNNFLPTYATNMLAVANFLKGLGSKVLLWQPPDNNVTPTATTWTTEEYEQASIGAAKSANVAWLNIHEHWGDYPDNTSKMYDTQHPNKRGHLDLARIIESVISQ